MKDAYFMESESAIVDLIHVYGDYKYQITKTISPNHIFIVQENSETNNIFYLIKKGNEFSSNKSKYLFINRCEKSYELVHPSILNISGFSADKPYLYYKFVPNSHNIDDIELSDANIQKIFYGIASGLSYLILHGYYYDDFSISSIIFDKFNYPKLFDYINFDVPNKNSEKNMISKYADILTIIINKKKNENSELSIHPKLLELIERSKQKTNLPTFDDFIKFFESDSYCTNDNVNDNESFQKYLKIFNYTDNIFYYKLYDSIDYDKNSIESISYHFYKKDVNEKDELEDEDYFYINLLPDFYIKTIANFYAPFRGVLSQYTFYDDLSLIFPEWKKLFHLYNDKNPFKIYKELIKQMKIVEEERNVKIYMIDVKNQLEVKIDALRIQAIHFLKKAFKQSNNAKVKIELAVQYINGSILPYNLSKALHILKEIFNADLPTQKLINHMKEKIETTMKSLSIKRIMISLPQEQKEILEKTEEDDVLSLLYCAFAFYTGYNGFPIMHALSIQLYRRAAKKSSHAMTLLGQLYLKGIIFPQNFKRAKNCFKRAAKCGDIKAGILDCLLRRHALKSFNINCEINDVISHYLPSFNSVIPNDSLVLSEIFHDNIEYAGVKTLYSGKLKKEKEKLHSERVDENCGMFIKYKYRHIDIDNKYRNIKINIKCDSNIIMNYSQKTLLLSSSDINNTKDATKQLYIAKSYFYGDNGYPVNYEKATKFFKLAADNGSSEAQWRYAMLCLNSFCLNISDSQIEDYFIKSVKQNNVKGKLFYSLYLRNREDNYIFERYIQECFNSGDLDAMYYYAMHLEKIDKSLDQSMYYYQKAADKGHFYSLIRLIYILKHKKLTELYEYYLNLSVSIVNESFLVKLIHFYDRKKMYDQSNAIIQIGIKLNYQLFNYFYADHILYGKGMDVNIDRAERIFFIAFNHNYPQKYRERYIYIMLEIFIRKNQHQEAAVFLLNLHSDLTEKYRKKFLSFYRKFDKIVAQENLITVNFCSKQYRVIQDILLNLRIKENVNRPKALADLRDYAFKYNNPYSLVILGKMYKQGKFYWRNLKTAVQYFALAAEKGCPEGYYYLGKEYYYGRILNQDFDKAKNNFLAALENYGEPRAGYYLYKIPDSKDDESIDDVESLKISAHFGYKRALYKYGHRLITGKDKRITPNEEEGRELIKQSALQNYKKAKRFCLLHGINKDDENDSSNLLNLYRNTKITLKISIDENDSFSDIDSETDDENINKIINNIKNVKRSNNANNNNDKNNLENDSDKGKLLDLISTLEEGKNIHKIDLKDVGENPESDNNNNNYDDDVVDIQLIDLSNSKIDRKSLFKIDTKKDKMNSTFSYANSSEIDKDNDEKNCKSSSKKLDSKIDTKIDEKNSDLSIDEDDDNISDLMAFWF